ARETGDIVQADVRGETDGRHVLRLYECLADRHRPLELTVDVPRLPYLAARQLQAQCGVRHELAGRVAFRDRGREHELLERTARLPPRLRRPVEPRVIEVATADERLHVTR